MQFQNPVSASLFTGGSQMGRVLLSGGFTNYTWTNFMKLSDATGIFLEDLGERRNIPEATGK